MEVIGNKLQNISKHWYMLGALTGAMQYKVSPQKDPQQDATQNQNRIESME